MASGKRTPYSTVVSTRYRQGDICRDLRLVEWAEVVADELAVHERHLAYAVVLSQECDLEHDFNNRNDPDKSSRNNDKYVPSILVCPAYLAELLRQGTHLVGEGRKMQQITTEPWKRLKQNNDYRYHFLPEDADNQLPDLVLDFKHFFTIPRDVFYREKMRTGLVCTLDDLFRENLSGRFAHYLSRIGLPELERA